jgi:hypothetical protein
MKHTNQEDSGRNQAKDSDQQRKANNAHTGGSHDSMGQQNKHGKKDLSGKQGSNQSNWQSEKKENKK